MTKIKCWRGYTYTCPDLEVWPALADKPLLGPNSKTTHGYGCLMDKEQQCFTRSLSNKILPGRVCSNNKVQSPFDLWWHSMGTPRTGQRSHWQRPLGSVLFKLKQQCCLWLLHKYCQTFRVFAVFQKAWTEMTLQKTICNWKQLFRKNGEVKKIQILICSFKSSSHALN